MLNEIGGFLGDKVGAVRGKHQASRLWIKGFGREKRRIRRERERCADIGRKTGTVTEWIAKLAAFL
jgi:hypothetical protein